MKPRGAVVKIPKQTTVVCQVCGKQKTYTEALRAASVRDSIVEVIRGSVPQWSPDGYICYEDLHNFRMQYVHGLLESEKGELDGLEQEVLRSLKEQDLLSENLNESYEERIGIGDRLADHIAQFGGSWGFILTFTGLCLGWIAVNSIHLILAKPADPYPFILLNLMLSCLAAVQAPLIMMSQNRQEAKDRLRSEYDYRVNLKAELEIRLLHEKLDHLLINQWQRLMDIQELQMELLEEGIEFHRKNGKKAGS
jgi:uncharacterized membrane protein